MYRVPPPPPPPDPLAKARTHVTANAALMCVLTFLHFCGLGSAGLNSMVFLDRHGLQHLSPNAMGELTAYAGAFAWALSGLVWAPINAYGLFKQRPWARTSSLLYWGLQVASCCCFPFGAYGLWSLLRADAKQLFAADPPL